MGADAVPSGDVRVHLGSDHVAVVEMCGGRDNYLDVPLVEGLADAFDRLESDTDCRAIVLCSEGRHFCAGAKLGGTSEDLVTRAGAERNPLYEGARRLFGGGLPVVAAVTGAAIGGGLGLALVADFRVTAPESRLSANFSRLGFHHGFGMTVTLPAVVGRQTALDLLYSGRRLTGTEAVDLRLCDRLVPADQVRSAAHEWAAEIATSAPLAIREIRRTMRADVVAALGDATLREHQVQRRLRETADFHEGVAAYAERRPPRFSGR